MLTDNDVNLIIIEYLIGLGDYSIRATSKYYLEAFAFVLRYVSYNKSRMFQKKLALISLYYLNCLYFHQIKKPSSHVLSLTMYKTKKNEKYTLLKNIKYVLGIWNFISGPRTFLLSEKRIENITIIRNPCIQVCWDNMSKCDNTRMPPDTVVFILGF